MDYAEVLWDARGRPYAPAFGDVYYGCADGLAESRAVYLCGNRLPERWRDWPEEVFVVGELGFGTGLNFAATWLVWHTAPRRSLRLEFVSLEKYPLSAESIRRILSAWPELTPFAAQLCAHYPPPVAGWHRLEFGAVVLHLWLGDVLEMFAHWPPGLRVDAWYLDGFAPAKNPAMWQPTVFALLARHSRPGTTFSTFSAAGQVRRDLQSYGFHVDKLRGYGPKREMLRGELGEYHEADG